MRLALIPLALLFIASTAAAQAPAADRAADEGEVIATIQRTFDAMRSKDTTVFRAQFDTLARIVITRTRNGQPQAMVVPIEQFVANIGRSTAHLDEQIFNPTVMIDDNMATVWVGYTFHVDGKFSHCGMDSFQLVRGTSAWRIIHVVDTQRNDRCPGPTTPRS